MSSFGILTYTDDRKIYIGSDKNSQEEMFDVLYKLIQAGLVEKVED